MFCKYCGGLINGTTCSKCGKASVLFAHSTELENLLDRTTSPNQKTYDEGFSKGYQKGLSEGYQNGINESKVAVPPRTEPQQKGKSVNKKLLAILCGIVFIIGVISSGMISNKIGYQTGYTTGASEGEAKVASLKAEFEGKYEEAKEAGRIEGESKAKADYEIELARLKETPTPSPTPTSPSTEETPLPNTHVLFSKELNGGTVSEDVRKIQDRLYILHFLSGEKDIVVDGKYGKGTEKAVKSFQEQNGIFPATGKVDIQTYTALFPEFSQTPIPKQRETMNLDDDEDASDTDDKTQTQTTDDIQTQKTDGLLSLLGFSSDGVFDFSPFFFSKTTPTVVPETDE